MQPMLNVPGQGGVASKRKVLLKPHCEFAVQIDNPKKSVKINFFIRFF